MKLALAQISMETEVSKNLEKSIQYCEKAKDADLLFFPEIQLSPFFPQYEKRNVDAYCMKITDEKVKALTEQAKKYKYYMSPNIYLEENGKRYDTSLWIHPDGEIEDKAKMVHVAQVENFYEQDYYTPSEDGFKVFDTEFGKIGIVICYDRHLPESIRTCVLKGADLVIIPTANTTEEPMEMFEWEVRVQAMQNQVFIAMCNRVGKEGRLKFAGESLVVAPDGTVLKKAGAAEELLTCDVDLQKARDLRKKMPYFATRRPECYL